MKTSSSKKSPSEKNNPIQKCNNGGLENDEDHHSPKRFSHSTRRKAKRRFDRTLLTIPDDELDHPNISFKNLIRLAEYNEGGAMPKKSDEEQEVPPTNQSFSGDYYNEGFGTYGNAEEGTREEENVANVVEASILNYQTFMDKTPISRWSKQETLLFYEGVRQFGADISMIQQLFPNRTRRQVKLKYKKEGRQYPQRLDDALMYRGKDFSHFEQVIERLQQAATQEKAESENGNMDDAEREDVAHGDGSEGGVEGVAATGEKNHGGSPAEETHDSDNEMHMWSGYKSD